MAEPTKIQLLLEAESRGILPADKAELLAEARSRGLVRESGPAPEMTDQQFTQERQQSAVAEAGRGSRQLAAGTVAGLGAAAGFIPGVGIPAQMAIGAGTETLRQTFGDQPYDPTQIGIAAAIPAAAKPIGAALKGMVRAGGKLFAPAAAKEAGIEAIAERVGQPATAAERALGTPASKAAFAEVARQGPVPTDDLANTVVGTIADLSQLSNPPKGAMKYLQNMFTKFNSKPNLQYADIAEELSLLGKQADAAFDAGNHVAGVSLNKARAAMLATLDQTSDAVLKANNIYRKEQSTKAMVKALRGGNSGTTIRKLFEDNKLVAQTFSPQEAQDIFQIADEISNMATTSVGLTNRLFNTLAQPIAQAIMTPTGRYLLRKTMKPTGHLTAAGIATVAQFMRGYTAQGGTE